MKKVLTLTIAAAMSLTILAGCSKPASTTGNSSEGAKYKDGKYSATYNYMDGKGWKPFLEVEIKDGKIAKATFDYKNAKGDLKSKDADYQKNMSAKVKIGPADYVPKINEALVKKQGAEIDTITGATHSVENAKALATALLAKAAKGDTSETKLEMNDTYTAKAKAADERGWTPQVSITYKDGKITSVVYDELDKDGKKKSENTEYNTQMKAASKNGMDMKTAAETLGKKYVETGKVEAVSGATGTTKNFTELVEAAKTMRK